MTSIRLLPLVIAAGSALLLLKGLGLVTGGGYVLTGPTSVLAAGGGGGGHAAPADESGGDASAAFPHDVTMADSSPTLADTAPVLSLGGEADAHGGGGHGEAAATDHGAADDAHAETNAHSEDGHGADALAEEVACPPTAAASPPAAGHGDDADHGAPDDDLPGFDFIKAPVDCIPDPGVNAAGDALPLIKNGAGEIVPLAEVAGNASSEAAVLDRLGERRGELDLREEELEMRLALIEAAEKRIAERTAALEALEAQINSLLGARDEAEKAQFQAVVSMYETMKPRDAAAILGALDMPVLLRVARAMSPRKMAPILAQMDPARARDLTASMAAPEAPKMVQVATDPISQLPQIVGQ